LYHCDTGEALLTPETVQHIISEIKTKGTDAWFSDDPQDKDWIPPPYRGQHFRRGNDTMDVWFDSGTSWSMLPSTPLKQADIYLEGTDQHRGWFQSSLLTSIATQGVSPFKTLITHGFVLDQDGRKMSKSEGNVISPRDVVNVRKDKFMTGVDGLRFWIASADYTSDVGVGKVALKNIAVVMKKFRATIRYIMGNLDGMENLEVKYTDLSSVLIRVKETNE
jgi:isoleucyl-tRNA synthetase